MQPHTCYGEKPGGRSSQAYEAHTPAQVAQHCGAILRPDLGICRAFDRAAVAAITLGNESHDGSTRSRPLPSRMWPPERRYAFCTLESFRTQCVRFARTGSGLDRGAAAIYGRLAHHSVAAVPSITVLCADSTPPLPCTIAVSQRPTWRWPHSPRNWRTASIKRNRPYIPGWQ
jgi:hypothetical protein